MYLHRPDALERNSLLMTKETTPKYNPSEARNGEELRDMLFDALDDLALSHLPDLLPITGLRRGAGFNEINNSALLAKAQKPPLLA
jgi:hypothetical protein